MVLTIVVKGVSPAALPEAYVALAAGWWLSLESPVNVISTKGLIRRNITKL